MLTPLILHDYPVIPWIKLFERGWFRRRKDINRVAQLWQLECGDRRKSRIMRGSMNSVEDHFLSQSTVGRLDCADAAAQIAVSDFD